MAFENSTFFIKKPPFTEIDSESFLYTKEVLSGRIFLGQYEERRYVPTLQEYRDLIIIHPEESELQHDLNKIKKKWIGKPGVKWLGITGPDESKSSSYCFWVKLSNLPFGCYWFQIKHVKLIDEEVILNLKCIRKYQAMETSKSSTLQKSSKIGKQENPDKKELSFTKTNIENWEFDMNKIKAVFNETVDNIIHHLTWRNCVTAAKVISAFLIVIFMGMVSLIGSLGEYLLKLIRELANLVQVLTPVFLQLIDFCSKIIGGLYLLLYGIFTKAPRPPPYSYSNFKYYSINPPMKNNPVVLPVDWRKRNQILREELSLDNYKSK